MIKPNNYKQYDSRWARKSHRFSDGTATIGGSGCGPTSCANIISALVNSKVTPVTTWNWFIKHGYMTGSQGAYWGGILACLKAYGIKPVTVTNDKNKIKAYLRKNYMCVAIMGPGNWTRGGHYITPYYVDSNSNVYISDPASTASNRLKNRYSLFASQKRNAWIVIDPKKYKGGKPKATVEYRLYVADDYVNVRDKASTKSKILGRYTKNKCLKLYGYKDGWYRCSAGKWKGHYVHESCLSKYKQVSVKYKFLYTMNLRSGYSTDSKVICTVPKGKVATCSKMRGRWAYFKNIKKVRGKYVSGFVKVNEKGGKTYLKKV